MEVRVIKTCHGLKVVKFHDGALLPPHVGMVDLCEAWHQEAMEIEWAMAHFASKRLPEAMELKTLYAWLTPEVMARMFQQLPASTLQHPID